MPSEGEAGGSVTRARGLFDAGPFRFESGERIESLKLAYWTMGQLNAARDNAVLLCHNASGNKDWALPFCRIDAAFDPKKYFLISVDMPGGGESSRAREGQGFPAAYGISDLSNALALLIPSLGLDSVRACCGPSMASLIGLDLAFRAPSLVRSLVLWNGGYRSDGFGRAVADALQSILQLDASPNGMRAAVKAFLPVLVERSMLAGLDDTARMKIIDRMAGEWIEGWEANELIARYAAIADCDLAVRYGGEAKLGAGIVCPTLCLSATGDTIFPPSQFRTLVAEMPRAEIQSLASESGHIANLASPSSPEFAFFNGQTARFLNGVSS